MVNGQFQHGSDKTVRIWDAKTEREVYRFARHAASVTSVAFAPGGRMVVCGGLDKTVRVLLVPGKS
jgi:WD40 repeat protein